jgi:hypothetical protein
MKHGPDVEQFGIELHVLPQPSQRSEIVDPRRVVKQKVGFGVSHKFSGSLRQFAVWDAYTCNGCVLHRDSVVASPPKHYAIVQTN